MPISDPSPVVAVGIVGGAGRWAGRASATSDPELAAQCGAARGRSRQRKIMYRSVGLRGHGVDGGAMSDVKEGEKACYCRF